MSDTYTALCVGGPKDGEMVEQPQRQFATAASDDAAKANYDWVKYHFVPLAKSGSEQGLALWVPEGTEADEAVQSLIDGYRNNLGNGGFPGGTEERI